MNTVTIHGSHGRMTVHGATGHVIERHLDGDEYASIAGFDPTPFARERGDLDILATGYWTVEGDYAEALTMRLVAHRGDMIFEDWVPMRLLPPPHELSSERTRANDLLGDELAARARDGHWLMTVSDLAKAFNAIGYALDRSMDCRSMARWMTGPRAGATYPCVTTGLREIDSGLSAFNFSARRDAGFRKLQEMRLSGGYFAVSYGALLEP